MKLTKVERKQYKHWLKHKKPIERKDMNKLMIIYIICYCLWIPFLLLINPKTNDTSVISIIAFVTFMAYHFPIVYLMMRVENNMKIKFKQTMRYSNANK